MSSSNSKSKHKLFNVLKLYKLVEFNMIKSFKYRIYPNKTQEVKLISTLTTCRYLYNNALAERIRQSELNKLENNFQVFPWGKPEWIHKYQQMKTLTSNKTEFQKQVYSQVLQNVLNRIDRSFKNFFNGAGYPRFQGKNRYNSFTYPQIGFKITENGKLKLSKIGEIRIFQHRKIEGKIKTCTIKKDVDHWYVTFLCEVDYTPQTKTGKSVGIDVGLTSLLTLSNGDKIEPPKYLRKSEKNLTKTQKQLSRKKKGSSNRNKQRIKVARIHRHIRNQRKDFLHKLSTNLVNTYDLIVFEKLQIQNMLRNHHLAKSISDAGWNQLIHFTTYKAEYAGKNVEQVNPKRTSMECCKCGKIQKMPLSQRIFKCPRCSNTMDRDENAATVIESRHIPTDCGNFKSVRATSIEAL